MNEDNTKIEDGAQNKDVDSNTSNEEVKIEVIEQEWDEKLAPIKPKKSLLKLFTKIILGLVAILVFVLIIFCIFHNVIVSSIVSKGGSYLVGTPVSLGKFDISLSGKVEIADFSVANPAGYQSSHAFKLKRVFVDVDLPTLLANQIVVNKVEIDGVAVDFESKLTSNNLNEIKANVENNITSLKSKITGTTSVQSEKDKQQEVPKDTPKEKKPGKSLLIKLLSVKNTSLAVSNKTLSTTLTLPVADIELKNIGGEGQSVAEVVNKVLNALFSSIQDTLSGGAKALSKAGIALGNSILNTGKDLGDTVSKIGESTLETGKKAGKAITETSKKLFENLGF